MLVGGRVGVDPAPQPRPAVVDQRGELRHLLPAEEERADAHQHRPQGAEAVVLVVAHPAAGRAGPIASPS